jgi:hypothetical protein
MAVPWLFLSHGTAGGEAISAQLIAGCKIDRIAAMRVAARNRVGENNASRPPQVTIRISE